METGEKD